MTKDRYALIVMISIMLLGVSFGGGYLLIADKVSSGKQFIYGNLSYKCTATNELKEDK